MMDMQNLNWYPGHMTRAKRMMQEQLCLVDLLIELADARVPESSRNPDIDSLCAGKPRILILNKADLADASRTQRYAETVRAQGIPVIVMDSRTRKDAGAVRSAMEMACRARIEKDRRRGIVNRPLRAMVAGIPNVGKSTLINTLAGRGSARVGNKPGVTRGKQWISLGRNIQLLDTPGSSSPLPAQGALETQPSWHIKRPGSEVALLLVELFDLMNLSNCRRINFDMN